jgi:hypothetical protein
MLQVAAATQASFFLSAVLLGYFNYKYRVVFVIRDGELAVSVNARSSELTA